MKLKQTPEAPKIEFPCDDYVIKVVGDTHDDLRPFVVSVLSQFDARVSESSFRENPSKNGRFVSLTVRMRIEQASDLNTLHQQLKSNSLVRMVL